MKLIKSIKNSFLKIILALSLITGSLVLLSVPAHASTPTKTCEENGSPFKDVSVNNSACDNILWLYESNITKPTNNLFKPKNSVSRQAMVAFLYRMINPNASAPKCYDKPFKDVKANSSFCGYIKWAADNKITSGYSNGTFGPKKAVTRGAMSAFLNRIVKNEKAVKCKVKPFKDVTIKDTFCGTITWMKDQGITYGYANGKYKTTESVTRQAMASFLKRVNDQFGPTKYIKAPIKKALPRLTKFDQELLNLVNDARAKKGISKLKVSKAADSMSLLWSRYMAENSVFVHSKDKSIDPSYNGFFKVVEFGAKNRTMWGENVGRGPSTMTAKQLFDAYMKSPGHKANIMNPKFKYAGFDSVKTRNGTTIYNTMTFIDKV